jgi:peptidyl-prolyl cis-trans isomerase-like 2
MKHSASSLSESVRSQIYGKTNSDAPSPTYIDWLEREPLYKRVRKNKQKGYVQIVTPRGSFTVQLHCDVAPMTCDNFLRLSEQGYYTGSVFHRLIPNFMIQGGIPGGQSAFGKPFNDEIDGRLNHNSPGVLAMANTGKANDNKSEFYITFSKCPRLDNKHTVFGKIVGGLSEFNKLNFTPTDANDKPKENIMIEKIQILEDPFSDIVKQAENLEIQVQTQKVESGFVKAARSDPMADHPKRNSMEIGKYIVWPEDGIVVANKKKRTSKPWLFDKW